MFYILKYSKTKTWQQVKNPESSSWPPSKKGDKKLKRGMFFNPEPFLKAIRSGFNEKVIMTW